MNEAGKVANTRIRDKRFEETPVCDPFVPHWTFKSAFSDPSKKTPLARTPVSVGTCTANNTRVDGWKK
jgi:hypothetical protein